MRITPNRSAFTVLLLLSLCLVSLAPSNVAAQADEKEKTEKETERRKDLERKAVGLLDEIAGASWGLKLPENRSLIQGSVADLLWRLDEKRARNLYWEALSSLGLPNSMTIEGATTREPAPKGPAVKDGAKRPANDQTQTLKQYYAMYELRRDFLRRVAQKDPQLALEMLRATRLRPPESVSVTYRLPDERDLEQEIANVAATRDPKQALSDRARKFGKRTDLSAARSFV